MTIDTPGIAGRSVPAAPEPLLPKDFRSGQEVRWCPGCGDHAILATFQGFLAGLQIPRENIVVVSGIGCSSRLPYYVETYGIHSIHGRAPTIATGVAINRSDLSVWVVTGDGDALSIGGNHLIHALRRNIDFTIVLFNNRIYGLTKGQYSPTSEAGKITKSTPEGSLENPFDPVALALGAGATFVARTIDSDRKHLDATLAAAAAHPGAALVEIYQNCPMFNDGTYDSLKDADTKREFTIPLEHGQPVVFGAAADKAVVRDPVTGALGIGAAGDPNVVIHDARADNPAYAFALAQLAGPDPGHTPIGVFRNVTRPTYDQQFLAQLANARVTGPTDLQDLLVGSDAWTVY
jgi:2-oxoglutarate ferredoxin oxidoreductase subunit beta